jgi:HD superfamily phosphohydrolase YqeK
MVYAIPKAMEILRATHKEGLSEKRFNHTLAVD